MRTGAVPGSRYDDVVTGQRKRQRQRQQTNGEQPDVTAIIGHLSEPPGEAPDIAVFGGAVLKTSDFLDGQITRLARLSRLDYERERKAAAKVLKIDRLKVLDDERLAKRKKLGLTVDDDDDDDSPGRALEYPDIEPWDEPVDGEALLDDIVGVSKRFMVMPEHAHTIAALWPVHSHLLDIFSMSPRLQIRSPDSECGKTTLMYILNSFVRRPQNAAAMTGALLFRIMEMHQPTLMLDEADASLPDNEDLRQVLDVGHHRYGEVPRLAKNARGEFVPRRFRAYGAVAFALIGELSGRLRTLDSRSITVQLKRKLAGEKVEEFEIDIHPAELTSFARRIVRFVEDNRAAIAAANPTIPLSNRRRDNWRPLFKIAHVVGGKWPARVLAAATTKEEVARSNLEQLLEDIREIFKRLGVDFLSSKHLVEELVALAAHPWAEYGKTGKPITENRVARMLKPIKIHPESNRTERGYHLARFAEEFKRYLGESENEAESAPGAAATVTSVTTFGPTGTSEPLATVTANPGRDGWKSARSPHGANVRDGCDGCEGGMDEIALSARQIRMLAAWYLEFLDRHHADPAIDDLDAAAGQALRERLVDKYDVDPAQLDGAVAQVMHRVFN